MPGEEISRAQTPTKLGRTDWAMYPLFILNQLGDTDMWQIGFNSSKLVLQVIYGTITTSQGKNGKISKPSDISIEVNNSGGDLLQQSLLQARKKYTDKYKMGYRPAGFSSSTRIEPQLSNKYRPLGTINPKTGKPQSCQLTPIIMKRGIAVDPKINGIRGRIYNDSDTVNANAYNSILILSRINNPLPWLNNIRDEMEIFFMYLPEGCGLDCELYTLDLTFSKLISAIKTVKFCHKNNKLIKAHIFDIIIEGMIFEDRKDLLYAALKQYNEDGYNNTSFEIVIHKEIYDIDEVLVYHDIFVNCGYEGIMIRKLGKKCTTEKQREGSYYKAKHNNNLLKYKNFIDEEGTCIAVIDGKDGDKGLAILIIRDIRNNEISMCPRGSDNRRRKWFDNPELCIGKEFTFRYTELSDNVPKIPVIVGIRDYE